MAVFQAGSRITAATLNAFCAPAEVIKPIDQSVTSSTTLVNDNALVLAVIAAATYDFAYYLDYEGNTGTGNALKAQFTVPTGATLRYMAPRLLGGVASGLNITFTDSQTWQADGQGAGTLCGVGGTGTLVMSSTAGNLQLQWAQGGSTGVATIVHAQSFVRLWRIT